MSVDKSADDMNGHPLSVLGPKHTLIDTNMVPQSSFLQPSMSHETQDMAALYKDTGPVHKLSATIHIHPCL